MQSERWQHCTEIFGAVVDLPREERALSLEQQCAGDEALRKQVELLLTYHDQCDGFIESPAFETAPELLFGDSDALLGRELDHYRIGSVLGVGGMGVVYLARDERLDRQVALKLLPPTLAADAKQLEKLKVEARTASALNHPNIVTIHEIGEVDGMHYIATEFIEGRTLRNRIDEGPIPPDEAAEIGQQIASALSMAHRAGIVHRDIKPENIMLRPDGYVKVLDFGIAKFVQPDVSAGRQTATQNLIIGTARYMSPEQARGLPVDARSDIWSVGVILYEMLTGQPPFPGETNTDVIASVLRSDPPPLDRSIPSGLQRIINRALEKDPALRISTAGEVRHALQQILRGRESLVRQAWRIGAIAALALIAFASWWLWKKPGSVVTDKQSIAVLPFQNLSPDPKDLFLAQGIQEEILTRLSKVSALKVISRTSTQKYQNAPENTREISQQLQVTNLVEGSIQKIGNAVKVTVQLIRGDRDEHLWAESYSRALNDIFGVEGEVAGAIAQQLNVKLTGAEERAVAGRPTQNAAAYEAYLRGVAIESTHVSSTPVLEEAVAHYGEAVRLDPKFALAWAHSAIAHSLIYVLGKDTAIHSAGVKTAAEQAMALDPQLAESWIAQGIYRYRIVRDFPGGLHAYEEALTRWPNSALALEQIAYLERRMGHWETGLEHLRRALNLDPNNIKLIEALKGTFLVSLRRWDEVDALNARISAFGVDDDTTFAIRALEFQIRGQLDEAAKLLEKIKGEPASDLIARAKMHQLVLERRFEEAVAEMKRYIALHTSPGEALKEEAQTWLTLLGYYQEWAGRTAEARDSFARAVEAMKPSPDTVLPITPKKTPCYLALAYAGLGEKEKALEQAQRAVEDYRDDAVDRPFAEWTLAQIQARFGDVDLAIAALPHLLEVPNGLTQGRLRYEPLWDPLRGDPRFQKLIASSAPNEFSPEVTKAPNKSIAVLPFENRTQDKSNANFADGIQDEILTRLSKIADLKVISRTSTQHYKSAPPNIPEIARQLGVALIVEGSVQKSRDSVRVNVQLIKAADDSHLWAETFDRKLTDIFAVESEVATAIADQLQAKLSPSERLELTRPPTTDVVAFDLYTNARNIIEKVFLVTGRLNLSDAVDLLNQAIARDPEFFLAYCALASAHGTIYFLGIDHTPARLALADAAVQAALRLRPDAGEAHLTRADNRYRCYLDYDGALAEVAAAARTLPNDSRVFELTGYILRRRGQHEEGLRNLERAVELDPRNISILEQLSRSYLHLRRYARSAAIVDRIITIDPTSQTVERGEIDFYWKADTRRLHERIEAKLAENPAAAGDIVDSWLKCALAERDTSAAARAAEAVGENSFGNSVIYLRRDFARGLVARMSGDAAKARGAFTAARAQQEKIVKEQPNYGRALCVLGLIDAGLGRKEEALREGRRAIELVPVEKDSLDGTLLREYCAIICAWVGEKDLAFQELESLARDDVSFEVHYGQLKLHPFWDPLRSDPRFERILARFAPKDTAEQRK